MPDNAVKESKEQVRAAIKNTGYEYSAQRITVNLSPADIKKEGSSFDLAIALGILAATGQIDAALLKDFLILGQLSLDGSVQPIHGALTIALSIPKEKFHGIILPAVNAAEAAVTDTIKIYPVKELREVINFLQCPESINPLVVNPQALFKQINQYDLDFADVKGQTHVKRGLEYGGRRPQRAVDGPPGSGKPC